MLSAVGSLRVVRGGDSTIVLNWTAPFTLDLLFIHPDITYCVEVVNSTSDCGITETEFTYPLLPRSWCDEYNLTVTPVNVVGDGEENSVLYFQNLSSGFEVVGESDY